MGFAEAAGSSAGQQVGPVLGAMAVGALQGVTSSSQLGEERLREAQTSLAFWEWVEPYAPWIGLVAGVGAGCFLFARYGRRGDSQPR